MKHFEPARLPEALPAILQRTEELGFGMASDPLTGSLLATLAASKPAGRFLELGTGTGVSTAWILGGMDAASRLTSIDSDGAVQAVAREAFAADQRVEFILGDALAVLRRQPDESFDFVFADAMPGKYEGLEDALRVLKAGGIYVVDDLLPQPNWPEGHAAKVPLLVEALRGNPDFIATPLHWATGLLIAVRRTGWEGAGSRVAAVRSSTVPIIDGRAHQIRGARLGGDHPNANLHGGHPRPAGSAAAGSGNAACNASLSGKATS